MASGPVEPPDPGELPADAEPSAPLTRKARAQARAAALQERGRQIADRAQRERRAHPTLDAAFDIADRDAEVGGGIMAGALAYRFFIWLLPLALVAVAGLGYVSDATSEDPGDAADSVGLSGIVSSSVEHASKSSSRWYALLVGIPILLYVTRSLLRTLIVVHRLVWTDSRTSVVKPTASATLQLLAALAAFLLISGGTAAIRHASIIGGVIAVCVLVVPYAALWLIVSMRLPHRDATWRHLIPGAIAFGLGVEILQAGFTFIIGPYAENKQGTYGSLGLAAALLLGLFFMSRIIVGSAAVNATLWDRRQQKAQADEAEERAATAARTVG